MNTCLHVPLLPTHLPPYRLSLPLLPHPLSPSSLLPSCVFLCPQGGSCVQQHCGSLNFKSPSLKIAQFFCRALFLFFSPPKSAWAGQAAWYDASYFPPGIRRINQGFDTLWMRRVSFCPCHSLLSHICGFKSLFQIGTSFDGNVFKHKSAVMCNNQDAPRWVQSCPPPDLIYGSVGFTAARPWRHPSWIVSSPGEAWWWWGGECTVENTSWLPSSPVDMKQASEAPWISLNTPSRSALH